jgi:hypothetical protein
MNYFVRFAISIGTPALDLLNHKPTLSVHSVFNNVINLSMNKDRLITISKPEQRNMPYGILCDFQDIDLRNKVEVGQKVLINHELLIFPDGKFAIDFSRSVPWIPHFQAFNFENSFERIYEHLEWYKKFAQDKSTGMGLTSLVFVIDELFTDQPLNASSELLKRAINGIQNIIKGFMNNDLKRIVDGGLDLIGLGPGLTPSGDDVLTSLLLCLYVTSPEPEQGLAKDALGQLAILSRNLTSDLSSFQYYVAAQGYLSERYMEVLDSILNSREETVMIQKGTQMISYGETSGMEILLGVLLGLNLSLEFNQNNIFNYIK